MDAHFNPKAAGLELSDYKIGDKLIPFKVVGEWKGPELAGMHYEQLIPWVNPGEGAFRVITGDYVTTEDGTGIVHIAPTFGADDDRVAKAAGVPPLMMIDKDGNRRPMVDMTGKFYLLEDLDPEFVQTRMNAADYDPFQGKFVKNAYDPEKTDKDENIGYRNMYDAESAEPRVPYRKACTQLSALLAYRQTGIILSAG